MSLDTPYRTSHDYSGFATHIKEAQSSVALCGTEVFDSKEYPVTAEKVVQDLPQQSRKAYYCSDCASSLIGVPKNEILAQRNF